MSSIVMRVADAATIEGFQKDNEMVGDYIDNDYLEFYKTWNLLDHLVTSGAGGLHDLAEQLGEGGDFAYGPPSMIRGDGLALLKSELAKLDRVAIKVSLQEAKLLSDPPHPLGKSPLTDDEIATAAKLIDQLKRLADNVPQHGAILFLIV